MYQGREGQAAAQRLPGIFDETIFSRRVVLMSSRYVRAPHPKTEIRPAAASIQKVLDAGWVGQLKIHGHRVQLHVPADEDEKILAYNRMGQLHKKELPEPMISEIRRLLSPHEGWNIVEGEWIKPKDKIFLFDFLKKDGQLMNRLPFVDRWKLLPREYLSPFIKTLPLVTGLERCLQILAQNDEDVEGLVFKSASPGFGDTTIVRCRRAGANRR
jgi:ATP-dependent DNA ligase